MEIANTELQMNEQVIPIKKMQKRRCSKVPIRELPPIMPAYQHSIYPQLYTIRPQSQMCYKWDAIIVDLDRTVIHGKRLSQKRWRKYVENGTIPSLAENQTGKWNRQIHRKGHQMHPFIRGRTMIYYRPFVWHLLAVLDYLKTHFGTKIIICTKAGEHYAASVITALLANFTSANPDLIDDIYNFHDLTDDLVEDGKPKKPFRGICQRHNLDAKNTLIVDDNALSWFGEDRKNTNFWMPPCYGYQIHAEDNELQLLCKYLWDPIQQHHLQKSSVHSNIHSKSSHNHHNQHSQHNHNSHYKTKINKIQSVQSNIQQQRDDGYDVECIDDCDEENLRNEHGDTDDECDREIVDNDGTNPRNQQALRYGGNNNGGVNGNGNGGSHHHHSSAHVSNKHPHQPVHYAPQYSSHHWTQESADTTDSSVSPKSPNDLSGINGKSTNNNNKTKRQSSAKYLNINNGIPPSLSSTTLSNGNHSLSSIGNVSVHGLPSIQSNLSNLSNISGISNVSGVSAYSVGHDMSHSQLQHHQTGYDEQHGVYYKANMVKFDSSNSTPKSSHNTPRRYKLRNGHHSNNSNSVNHEHTHSSSSNNNGNNSSATRHSPKTSVTRTKKKNYFFESKSRGSKKLVAKLIGK